MAVSRCPVCEVSVALIERPGEPMAIAEHRDRRFDGLGKCPGSGQTIVKAEELVAGRRGEAR